ncbi:hypothetical protein P7K49_010804 [Saguinus oedipus]|uniref:Elongin-C n=1 Tax=Saguinus oedipus TaxID=9490 RepID=A0ABQ9VNV0_SAGOE|nr:hypothetical protein P7K49_010804 [Saguinus oedipus]
MDGKEKTYGGCEGPDAMYVKLISSDGHEFIVKREHALTSGTIKAMLSGPGQFAENETNEVNFREIPSHVLSKVCMYFRYKVRYTNSSTEIPEFPIAPEIALQLLTAANFLDYLGCMSGRNQLSQLGFPTAPSGRPGARDGETSQAAIRGVVKLPTLMLPRCAQVSGHSHSTTTSSHNTLGTEEGSPQTIDADSLQLCCCVHYATKDKRQGVDKAGTQDSSTQPHSRATQTGERSRLERLRKTGGGVGGGKMAPSPTKHKDRSDEKSKDRSKDKGATKESSEKDRSRDKTRKRRRKLPVVAAVPGLGPARPPAQAPAPALAQAVAPALPQHPAAQEAPAPPEAPAPAAPLALRVLLGADTTTEGAPTPNPNHLKEMKRRGRGGAHPPSPPKCTLGDSPGM